MVDGRLVTLALTLLVVTCAGCVRDPCEDRYFSCTNDRQCHPPELPPGYCLDDGETGKICADYFDNCPTHYRWRECAGTNGKHSSWAGRCVRPWQLPDLGTDGLADAAPVPIDMSVELDGPGSS